MTDPKTWPLVTWVFLAWIGGLLIGLGLGVPLGRGLEAIIEREARCRAK